MSDEREKRLESDELGEETEDVEAHQHLRFGQDAEDVRLAEGEEEGDEVEGHMKAVPKHDLP